MLGFTLGAPALTGLPLALAHVGVPPCVWLRSPARGFLLVLGRFFLFAFINIINCAQLVVLTLFAPLRSPT